MLYIIIGLLGVVIALVFVLMRALLQNTALRKDTQALIAQVDSFQKNEQALKAQITESSERYSLALQDNARAQAQIQAHATLLQSLEQKYAQNLATLKAEFDKSLQTQSQSMLQQNKLYLLEDSKKMLDSLFAPVRESIETYKEGMKEYKEKLVANEAKLETNIKNMFAYSQEIGQNADKLAQILKGDKKIRGNFAYARFHLLSLAHPITTLALNEVGIAITPRFRSGIFGIVQEYLRLAPLYFAVFLHSACNPHGIAVDETTLGMIVKP